MRQNILVIGGSEDTQTQIRARLCMEPVQLHFASDGGSGLEKAHALMPDLILLDVDLPDPDGFEVCRRLKADPRVMQIPVIFLTGASATEQKIKGLELGAIDYITKPFEPAELRGRVRAALRTKYLLDLLARKAMIDGLTGLWNRAYFEQRMANEKSRIDRSDSALSCIMVDIDQFKSINDRFGHPFGDDVLRSVGQVLQETCRKEDVVCRYGGEEFVILTPDVSLTGATSLAERLRQAIAGLTLNRNSQIVRVTASFGVSDTTHFPASQLVELADRSLCLAKQTGRNRVVAATDLAERVVGV